jgi:hypothetical protein
MPTTKEPPKTLSLRQLIFDHPFPPVTIPERMTWTASSIKLFRSCRRKWFWKYIMRLRPHYRSRHLIIGSAFHHCLGEWYKGRRASMAQISAPYVAKMQDEVDKNVAYYDQEELDKIDGLLHTFTGMVMGYERVYTGDKKHWRIVPNSVECKFTVDMGDFDYAGKIDLCTEDRRTKLYHQVEHKTASKIPSSYVERLNLDTQVRGYVFGANKFLGLPIHRVVYDVVRKCQLRKKSGEEQEEFTQRIADDYATRPEHYFFREDLMFDKAAIDAFEYEVRQTHDEYEDIVHPLKNRPITQKLVESVFGDKDPLNPRSWNPNDSQCTAYFQLCPYHVLCTGGLDHGTAKLFEQGDDLNEELADED